MRGVVVHSLTVTGEPHPESAETKRKYRLIYGALSAALLAVIVIAFVFGSPEGEDIGLPEQIEAIRPVPQETVLRQAQIEVDMQVGYEVEIWVDDVQLPAQEILFVEGTAVFSWAPGIDRLFTEWTRGEHTATVKWRSVTGLPDVGEYTWTFRVF